MDGSSDDQIYVGQKCQDTTEGTGKEEVSQRDLLEETSFTESALKEKKEGCRNPFSNVPFPSVKNKELRKVTLTSAVNKDSFLPSLLSGDKEKRIVEEVGRRHMAWYGCSSLNYFKKKSDFVEPQFKNLQFTFLLQV